MKKLSLLFILFLPTINIDLFAQGFIQDWISPPAYWSMDANIDSINMLGENYYSDTTNNVIQLQSNTNEASSMPFARWRHFWLNRADSLGNGYRKAYSEMNKYVTNPTCEKVGHEWRHIGPTGFRSIDGGEGQGIIISLWIDPDDPNHVLAGSNSGGLFESNDAMTYPNNSWKPLTDDIGMPYLGVQAIAVNPSNKNEIYIATGNTSDKRSYGIGIYKSINGGVSWQPTNWTWDAEDGDVVFDLKFSPIDPNVMYAVTSKFLWYTNDGWNTNSSFDCQLFQNCGFPDYRKLAFHPTNPDIVYAAGKEVRKWDWQGGMTQITPPQNSGNPIEYGFVATTPADPSVLYYIAKHDHSIHVWHTYDEGQTWVQGANSLPVTKGLRSFTVSKSYSNICYVGGQTKFYTANDMGVSGNWVENIDMHDDVRTIETLTDIGNGDRVFVGNDGGVSLSEDGAQNFIDLNGSGLNITQIYGFDVDETDETFNVTGSQDVGSMIKHGANWIQENGGDGGQCLVNDFDPGEVFIQQSSGYGTTSSKRSIDGGNNFNSIPFAQNFNCFNLGITDIDVPMELDKTGQFTMAFALRTILKFNGIEYECLSNVDITDNDRINSLDIQDNNSNIIWFADGGFQSPSYPQSTPLYRTLDGGNTWEQLPLANHPKHTSSNWQKANSISLHSDNPNIVWVTYQGFDEANGKVWRCDNATNPLNQITWTDITYNLPNLPVNVIKHHKRTNTLWIGNEIGVYYMDAANGTEWICYSKDLPNAVVTDIEFLECAGKVRASTYGRGLWENIMPPFLSDNPIIINANNFTFSSTTYQADVVIASGINATIPQNTTIEMYGGRSIIVEPGAKLTVEGKITNSCNGFWNGIQVWGTNGQPQQPTNNGFQGIVELKNNAIIEWAVTAVSAIKKDGLELDFNKTGGIIWANNTRFFDCINGIELMRYTNFIIQNNAAFVKANLSRIEQCDFTNTVAMHFKHPGLLPGNRINLYAVDRIRIRGNRFFINGPYGTLDKGTGIRALDASFNVEPYCTNTTQFPCPQNDLEPNDFINLSYGIRSSGSTGFFPVRVNQNNFISCHRATLIEGLYFSEIRENTFNVPNGGASEASYGLYLRNCHGYHVEGNAFNGNNTSTTGFGLLVHKSGEEDNEIYGNTFSNFRYAHTMAYRENANNNLTEGLRIKCNNFNEQTATQSVALIGVGNLGRIAFEQGQCIPFEPEAAAGNLFSNECATNVSDIFPGSAVPAFEYNYQPGGSFKTQPICYNFNVNPNQCVGQNNYDPPESCPTDPLGGIGSFELLGQKEQKRNLANGLVEQIDGGDTDGLLSLVNTGSNGQVKNGLLAQSPYLSDTVLVAYAESSPPNGHIKQVVLANSPVTQLVMDALEELNLPNGIMNQIYAAQDGSQSPRNELEQEANYNYLQANLMVNQAIRNYLYDTTLTLTEALDSTILVLETEGGLQEQCMLVEAMLANDDFTGAQQQNDGLATQNGGTVEPLDDFCALHNLLIQLEQTIEGCFSMAGDTNGGAGTIGGIADGSDTRSCLQASLLLEQIGDDRFPEFIEIPTASQNKMAGEEQEPAQQHETLDKRTETMLKAYPNPFKEQLTVEVYLQNNTGSLHLYDLLGKERQLKPLNKGYNRNTINTSGLSEGVYVLVVKENNLTVNTKKIVLQR